MYSFKPTCQYHMLTKQGKSGKITSMSMRTNRIFRDCQLKTIEVNPDNLTQNTHRNDVVLHCPRTEDERVTVENNFTHESVKASIRDLARVAGATVCGPCPYAGKSEVEVTLYRTELAKAEAERLYAYSALEAARADVELAAQEVLGQQQPQVPGIE